MRGQAATQNTLSWSHLNKTRFGFILFAAAALHGLLLLALQFKLPDAVPVQQTLDITLSRYSQKEAPKDAKFLAQNNQEGSGHSKSVKAPSTRQVAPLDANNVKQQAAQATQATKPTPATKPMPVTPSRPAPETRKQPSIEAAQKKVITAKTHKNTPAAATQSSNTHASTPKAQSGSSTSLLARSLDMANMQAQLKMDNQLQANANRVLRFTSASTLKYSDAAYLDNWRQRVESIGNLNYPEEALRKGVGGRLSLMVSIRSDGTVENIEILKSSGHRFLDDAAIRIVQLASPFQPFTADMRQRADRLDIIRTWAFEKDGHLY